MAHKRRKQDSKEKYILNLFSRMSAKQLELEDIYFSKYNRIFSEDGTYKFTDISKRNEITCRPGCACPKDKPIWHEGECVKLERCESWCLELAS